MNERIATMTAEDKQSLMNVINDMARPNFKIVSSENDTVYVNSVDYATIKSEQGKYYMVSASALSIVLNGFLALQITNPADSGKTMYIDRVSGGLTATATVDILRNATFAAVGTTATPYNANWGAGDNSAMKAKYISQATDPTSGGTLLLSDSQASGPFEIGLGGRLIVPGTTSDRQLYVRVTNGSVANTMSINIAWWEI